MKFLSLIAVLCATICTANGAAVKQTLSGLNYNPRRVYESCPTVDQIKEDFQILKTLTSTVRIYSLTDCFQGGLVLQAAASTGMKVYLGMWTTNNTALFTNEFTELKKLISSSSALFTNVEAIIVGSEAIYRKELTVANVSSYITEVKGALKAASLNVPVTFADVFQTYLDHPDLIQAVDIGMVNQFPYWEGYSIETAIPRLFDTMTSVRKLFGSKKYVISETGWPDSGNNFGKAVPSPANQVYYFEKFLCRANSEGWNYLYFAAFDDDWKPKWENSEYDVEKHWGIYTSKRTLKSGYDSQLKVDCSTLTAPPSTASNSTKTSTSKTPTSKSGNSTSGSSSDSSSGSSSGASDSTSTSSSKSFSSAVGISFASVLAVMMSTLFMA